MTSQKITIIGLGYVGLPLAVEFGRKYSTIGFDINSNRVEELKKGIDKTKEVETKDLLENINLHFTSNIEEIIDSNIYIVTVPTPIDKFNQPDLTPIINATKMLAAVIKKGDLIIYESTVYPGCTEEVCVPIIESISGLKYNYEFYYGYSPERINPGDKINTLTKIKKVTSGSNPEISEIVDNLYASIIQAGTFKAKSIKVAEASKAIENAQRDINIAFINELSNIFYKIGIDTSDVLEAAGTKWNFHKYTQGLVGGHCIGVDPYYLAFKAINLGYEPKLILSSREINNSIPAFIKERVANLLPRNLDKIDILVLGITFKENCPDIRNSKSYDLVNELQNDIRLNINLDLYDPYADKSQVQEEYGLEMIEEIEKKYDVIILTVSHDKFLNFDYLSMKKNKDSIIFDCKSFLPREIVNDRL